MNKINIKYLKGLIKVNDFVSDSSDILCKVISVDDSGFSYSGNNYSHNYNSFTSEKEIYWLSQESLLIAIGISLQQVGENALSL